MATTLLFSIDLEDVRDSVKNGEKFRERVPANTEKYLEFLEKKNAIATFFVVGSIAKRYPSLIREIATLGHEIACHSNTHIQLDKHDPRSFKEDLLKNIDNIHNACQARIKGFRAPTFSLTEKTKWAYDVLNELGFTYSSSVLPAGNPLYGWPEFGERVKKINDGLWELPITLYNHKFLKVPVMGGVYFRIIPYSFIKNGIAKIAKNNRPLLSYFHPYDIDTEQERFMHPDIGNNPFYNHLLFMNRGKVFKRMEKLNTAFKFEFKTYSDYVETDLNKK